MLITKNIVTTLVPLNFERLSKIYGGKMYDNIEISIEHLSEKSPIKIYCKCEICNKISLLAYRCYLRNKNRYNYYSCKKCKNKKTSMTKNFLYNDPNYNNSTKMIKTKESLNIYIPIESVDDFKKYRKIVNRFTMKQKKTLFKYWDGNDFYDKKYIKDNLKLNSNNMSYPTIDHKISLHEGFIKNIPPYIIGGIDNLCITKRKINLLKSNKQNFVF